MHLRHYLSPPDGEAISVEEFAERVGADRTTVLRWRDGKIIPSADSLKRIAEVTDNQVTPNDMLGVTTRDAA